MATIGFTQQEPHTDELSRLRQQGDEATYRPDLARRFLTGFLISAVPGMAALSIVTAYSVWSLTVVNRQLEEISLSLEATRGLQMALIQAGATPADYLLQHHGGEERRFNQAMHSAQEKLTSCASAACHSASLTPGEMASLLTPRIDRLRTEGGMVFKTAWPPSPSVASARLEEIGRLVGGISLQIGAMSDTLVGRVEKLQAHSRELSRRVSLLTELAIALALALGGASTVVLARRVSRPVEELLVGTRRVRAGDWDYQVQVRDRGEIGELAASFNNMLDEIRRHRDQLKEWGRVLEERVRERTEELKRRDEALRQSEKLASVGLLASGVAHELNNPLTSILMNCNLMMEDVGEASPLYQELKKIDADTSRCKRIIDDLRTFSRRRDLERAPCRVGEVVEQALRMVEHEMHLRGIRVETHIAPELPEVVWDRERIAQVLTNLFINAAQAMEDGGCLTVSARPGDAGVILEVRDTGVGIPNQYRSQVLDPFFTTKRDGTGLGLSISYGIVQEHGGRIDMQSTTREEAGPEGKTGTTVSISLPVSPREAKS